MDLADAITARRTGVKYGKTARNFVVHDFFDGTPQQDNASRPYSSKTPISPNSPGISRTPARTSRTLNATPVTARKVQPAHVTSHSSTSSTRSTASDSPSRMVQATLVDSVPKDQSVFDLNSSDEESSGSKSSKRRKLNPPKRLEHRSKSAPGKTLKWTPEVVVPALTSSKSGKPALNKAGPGPGPAAVRGKPPTLNQEDNTAKLPKEKKVAPAGDMANKQHRPRAAKQGAANTQPAAVPSRTARRGATKSSTKASTSDPDHSKTATPKPKRPPLRETETTAPTPGQLGFTGLRLSPHASSVGSEPSDDEMGVVRGSSRRGRTRLIDRLDARTDQAGPRKSHSQNTKPVERNVSTGPKVGGRVGQNRAGSVPQDSRSSSISRTESSQPKATYGKARTTYAKERSHLSDMVDEVDNLGGGGSSSQPTSSQLASQLSFTAGPSQLQLELEMEDGSSDDQGPNKLKSIHELRQAGANNRFDREVETLMEDIDPRGARANKSLRLQALMKMIGNLNEDDFCRFFSDRGLNRLLAWAELDLDVPTAFLVGIALWKLAQAERSSPNILSQMFKSATALSHLLFTVHQPLGKLGKERRHNLTKVLARDLLKFEQLLSADQGMLNFDFGGSEVRAATVALGCLTETLTGLAKLHDRNATVQHGTYAHVLDLLRDLCEQLREGGMSAADKSTMAMALTFLELCSGMLDGGGNDSMAGDPHECEVLGKSLTSILQCARDGDDKDNLDQAALRLMVSLSNNRPDICRAMGSRTALTTIVQTVESDFGLLASQAERKQTVDETKLNTVILCLGCLLNFAECDFLVRRRISTTRMDPDPNPDRTGRNDDDQGDGPTLLAHLVDIFNQRFVRLSDATTAEESQVLVAFGYLSMFLCTMGLDAETRSQISHLLDRNRSFDDVCGAAGTFLSHFRTLERLPTPPPKENHVKPEEDVDVDPHVDQVLATTTDHTAPDGVASRFSERFDQILTTVQSR